MVKYKLQPGGVKDQETGANIPDNEENSDWRAYQRWLEEGNKPEPWRTGAEILENAKSEKLEQIRRSYESELAAISCPLANNRPVQLDKNSQDEIGKASAIADEAIGGNIPWDTGFFWRLADNSNFYLPTPQEMKRLAWWAASVVPPLRRKVWEKTDAIRAAMDIEAVNRIDWNNP